MSTGKKEKHRTCSICKHIPDRADAFWKGGEGKGLPSAESKLIVVGAPFFNDRTSYSHACLKKCPQCGTFYDWSFTYEFLVNGTEDEITLTRLSNPVGKERERQAFDQIHAAEEKFREQAKKHVKTLLNSRNGEGVYGAANFLQGGQGKGHSLHFALDALTLAMIRVSTLDPTDEYLDSCSSLLYLVLIDEVKKGASAARQVLDLLEQHHMTDGKTERIRLLTRACRNTLKGKQH